jgi:hypothetical protein
MLTPSERKKLDHTLIETLGVSSATVFTLSYRGGMITVGDCVAFFERCWSGTPGLIDPVLLKTVVNEVLPRLIELGYVEDDWDEDANAK